jgi:hypothetical protein
VTKRIPVIAIEMALGHQKNQQQRRPIPSLGQSSASPELQVEAIAPLRDVERSCRGVTKQVRNDAGELVRMLGVPCFCDDEVPPSEVFLSASN